MTDYRDFIRQAGAPVISHEIGQWCVYPNLNEISKYTGWLKPKNFEIFRASLEAHGMLNQAHDFLIASGKLQTICYKEEIEAALRTPGMAGFELLDLHDFPGQGTALVGVLDPFWDSKGYATAEAFRRFACETVPLARMPRRVFLSRELFEADVDLAHYGPADLVKAPADWRIRDPAGQVLAAGSFDPVTVGTGSLQRLGTVRWQLGNCQHAQRLNLEVRLLGTTYANDWDFWAYPATVETATPAGILVTPTLDTSALNELQRGGRVLLLPPPDSIRGDARGRVSIGFSPIFWNTAWTGRQPPHTLGILCDPSHPALAAFPTESHSNWQWWELLHQAHPLILDNTPPALTPIVQVIDDWVTNRKLALVVEARVGQGRLLACGIDLTHDLAARPVARQMRSSLLAYMASDRFQPGVTIEVDQLRGWLKESAARDEHGSSSG